MLAKDIMTADVFTVTQDTPVGEIAKLLLSRRISGVPVVDGKGKLCGIVSEGDLMRRADAGTAQPRSWWLTLLTDNRDLAREYVKTHGLTAKDVMTPTVVTVNENTDLAQVATLLERNRIKRVPVMSAGKLIGIISRANLLQALASAGTRKARAPADDRALREAVLASFRSKPWAPDVSVNVTVQDRQVCLYGLVATEDERKALRIAAEEVAGVGKVSDHLAVSRLLRSCA